MEDKRTHTVPQFYLRNFGSEIYRYDKLERKAERASPKTSCWEWNFYTQNFGKLTGMVEGMLGKWENTASRAISAVVKKDSYTDLEDEHKAALCWFVTIQYLRTPEYRLVRQSRMNSVLDALAESVGVDDWVIREKEEYAGVFHLQSILDLCIPLSQLIARKGVCLCINETRMPLWTSDNPVVRHNDLLSSRGFGDWGTHIVLPLTPKRSLFFYDRAAHVNFPDVFLMDKGNVIRDNHLQTRDSTRYVFSHTGDFDMIEKMIESNAGYENRYTARVL